MVDENNGYLYHEKERYFYYFTQSESRYKM